MYRIIICGVYFETILYGFRYNLKYYLKNIFSLLILKLLKCFQLIGKKLNLIETWFATGFEIAVATEHSLWTL